MLGLKLNHVSKRGCRCRQVPLADAMTTFDVYCVYSKVPNDPTTCKNLTWNMLYHNRTCLVGIKRRCCDNVWKDLIHIMNFAAIGCHRKADVFDTRDPFTNMEWLYSRHGWIITCPVNCKGKLLIHPKTSTTTPMKFGMGKWFHPTLYDESNDLSMLWLTLIHFSKKGHRQLDHLHLPLIFLFLNTALILESYTENDHLIAANCWVAHAIVCIWSSVLQSWFSALITPECYLIFYKLEWIDMNKIVFTCTLVFHATSNDILKSWVKLRRQLPYLLNIMKFLHRLPHAKPRLAWDFIVSSSNGTCIGMNEWRSKNRSKKTFPNYQWSKASPRCVYQFNHIERNHLKAYQPENNRSWVGVHVAKTSN